MKIICDGDSWVFGCEIVNPEISKRYAKDVHPGAYDYLKENDVYRIPRIFPTHLSQLFKTEVINLSWPADDNGTILNRTITYLASQLKAGVKPEDLFVIIGWSSPERNFFWYKDESRSERFRLWPQVKHFSSSVQEKIWEYYVSFLWHPEEYIPRYIMNVVQLQNFCNAHNIKWLCFNSFYQTPKRNINEWEDLNIRSQLEELKTKVHGFHLSTSTRLRRENHIFDYVSLWDTVDPIRFYKKDQQDSTFRSFIVNSDLEQPLTGWHPSPEGHKLWAQELHRYITDNSLL